MQLTRTHNNRPRRHRAQDRQARGLTLTTKPLWLRAAFRKQAAGETAPWMMSSRCSCAMPKLASLALLSRDTRLALPSVSCSHPLFMACCMSQGATQSLVIDFPGGPTLAHTSVHSQLTYSYAAEGRSCACVQCMLKAKSGSLFVASCLVQTCGCTLAACLQKSTA